MYWKIATLLCLLCCASCSKQEPPATSMQMDDMKSEVPGYAMINIDPNRVQLLGITTEKVEMRDLTKTIRTVGIVEADERNIATIQTKFKGWIEKLFVNFTGIFVKKGDPLFSVYSPDLLATQEEFLLALKSIERPLQGRFAKEFYQSNQALLDSARQRLELWNIPKEEIARLEQTKTPITDVMMRSPITGIVLKKNAFVGMNVEAGMEIFTIADLSKVWIMADIYEQDIALISLGQKAELKLDAFPGTSLKATVSYISYVVEGSTRTAKVRFDVDNSDARLKPSMYATALLTINLGTFLSVPDQSIINTGKRKIVFISTGKGHYEPREIEVGVKGDSYIQVLAGLKEGEEVVTSAQFFLDSESRLKAGQSTMPGMSGH